MNAFKLVLDYDGVIFKNPYAMEKVCDRSAQFVSKKLNMSYNNARMVNTTRYKVYGHTVKYLNDVGVDATLAEYNSFVFENIDWDDIEMNIRSMDYDQVADLHMLNEFQGQKSILFTNAPRTWIEGTMGCMGIDPESVFESMFTCERLEELKPNLAVYELIEHIYPQTDLLFIDDSILNIHGLGHRWNPYWFKPYDNIYQCGCEMIDEYLN